MNKYVAGRAGASVLAFLGRATDTLVAAAHGRPCRLATAGQFKAKERKKESHLFSYEHTANPESEGLVPHVPETGLHHHGHESIL